MQRDRWAVRPLTRAVSSRECLRRPPRHAAILPRESGVDRGPIAADSSVRPLGRFHPVCACVGLKLSARRPGSAAFPAIQRLPGPDSGRATEASSPPRRTARCRTPPDRICPVPSMLHMAARIRRPRGAGPLSIAHGEIPLPIRTRLLYLAGNPAVRVRKLLTGSFSGRKGVAVNWQMFDPGWRPVGRPG